MEVRAEEDVFVELFYPRTNGNPYIYVDMMSVRANDGIRLQFDYERDGWSIQAPHCDFEGGEIKEGSVVVPAAPKRWSEVAFVEGWSLEKKCKNQGCTHYAE